MILAPQNTRLAVNMQLVIDLCFWTSTDQLVGYTTARKTSPHEFLEKCFDRVPTFYNGQTMFVEPITRPNFPFANEVHCFGGYKKKPFFC